MGSRVKAGFYVYWHAPKTEAMEHHYFRLLAGPFIEWTEADKIGPKVVDFVKKHEPHMVAYAGATYGICRMEGPILPPGSRNAALWVSQALLVP